MDVEKYSGPALRATRRMVDFWGMSAAESDGSTGIPNVRQAADDLASGKPFVLSVDQLHRISVLLCVWKHVSWRFADYGAAWLREHNDVYGATPLSLLCADMDAAMRVRDAFDLAEQQALSGYAVPDYPVKGAARDVYQDMLVPAPREDGGPGRIATDQEVETALHATAEDADPVVDYLRDK